MFLIKGTIQGRFDRVLFISSLLLWITLAFQHGLKIFQYAVNIPASDEWEALADRANLTFNQFAWIFTPQNENRIVPTRVLNQIFFYASDWNFVSMIRFNYLMYLALVLYLSYLLAKVLPQKPWVALLSSVFLLTALPWEVHSWANQSCFHFLLLGAFACCHQFFLQPHSLFRLPFKILAGLLTLYSLYAGLVIVPSLLILLALRLAYRAYLKPAERTVGDGASFMLLSISLLAAIWAYFQFNYPALHTSQLALPYRWEFWNYFFNLVALGFGLLTVDWTIGFGFALLTYLPLLLLVWKKRNRLQAEDWLLISLYSTVTVILASIAIGRGLSFGVNQSKSSRYAEFASLLIPLMLCAWWVAFEERPRLAALNLMALLLVTTYSLRNSWHFDAIYHEAWTFRNAGRDCAFLYFRKEGDGNCPTIYWSNISERLENARLLKISFYREWAADNEPLP